MRNLIRSLPEQYGMTVLISSHLLSEIDQIATTVGVVSRGRLIFQDSIEAMRRHAQQKVTLRVGQAERAWRALMASGMKAELAREQVTLIDPTDDAVAAAVRTLVQEGVPVYRVEEEKRSLEEIFLQMTGGEHLV